MDRSSTGQARRLFGNVLATIPAVILIVSAVTKFGHVAKVVAPLAQLGFFGGRLLFIAVAELAGAILFLLPRTRAVGLLLVSSYLGGAIAAHMGHGQSIVSPALILAFFWIGTALRNPEALWSFASGNEQVAAPERERIAA